MYNPSDDETDGERAELYAASSPGDLAGWTLGDTAGNTFTFPSFVPTSSEYFEVTASEHRIYLPLIWRE